MSVVVGSGVVLSGAVVGDAENGNNPIIGYENRVTIANITSTTEDPDLPVINLANPATHLYWEALLGSPSFNDEYITIAVDTAELIDYVGIVRHNFYSASIPISIEIQSVEAGAFVEVIADTLLPNDGPVIFRFAPQAAVSIRIRLQPSLAATPLAPQAGVVYVGKLLVLQRRIYVGHMPITMGRQTKIVNGRSESGNFLGRIVLNESRATQVSLMNLIPAWYRTYFDPFVAAAVEIPFFFAWRPLDYPYETGYAWLTDDPKPSNQRPNGMMQVSFSMMGTT